jgi:L-lactate dehydrogenase complex protein LldF
LSKFLIKRGIDAVETDLGEYILQLADEPPFHMTMPALHKTRQEISTLFQEHLGSGPHTDPKELTAIARKTLRDRFAEADMGVIGANFMVAETGSIVLVTNEGNGRMVTTLPNVLVSVAGIEKVIPALEDLGVFLKLLARSATGQPITSYTTIVSGPRGTMEEDGPQEFHLILLDNGRTKLLEDPELREALHCIRCGACSTVCPVYRKIGGHSYGWVYSGPIGAILTPVLTGLKAGKDLPFASSLCGACRDVCPVKINIPHLLVQLRKKIVEGDPKSERAMPWLERQVFSRGMAVVKSRESMDRAIGLARLILKPWERDGWVRRVNLPALKSWTSNRDFPAVAPQSFSQLWKSGAVDKERE